MTTLTLLLLFWWSGISPSTGFLVSSNDLYFFLWTLKDLAIYYFFTFFTFLVLATGKLLELFYLKLVGWLFLGTQPSPRLFFKTRLEYLKAEDSKYLYFNWLKRFPNALIGDEFSKPSYRTETHTFFSNFFSLLETLVSGANSGVTVPRSNRMSEDLVYPHLLLPKTNTQATNQQKNPSLIFLNSHHDWAPNFGSSLFAKDGVFYVTRLDFGESLNLTNKYKLGTLFSGVLSNKTAGFKVQRLLFNYNFFHHKSLKGSHKLTMVKRLMGSGFYDSKLVKKNIWASDFFGSLSSPQTQLKGNLEAFYGDLFRTPFLNERTKLRVEANQTLTGLNFLKAYEQSFFWFLKRAYFQNSLVANRVDLSPTPALPTKGGLSSLRYLGLTAPQPAKSTPLLLSSFTLEIRSTTLQTKGLIPLSADLSTLLPVEADLWVRSYDSLANDLTSSPLVGSWPYFVYSDTINTNSTLGKRSTLKTYLHRRRRRV